MLEFWREKEVTAGKKKSILCATTRYKNIPKSSPRHTPWPEARLSIAAALYGSYVSTVQYVFGYTRL